MILVQFKTEHFYFRVDKCCRAHDHCPIKIKAFSSNYGATNYHVYTKSHCACDDLFYKVSRVTVVFSYHFQHELNYTVETANKVAICPRGNLLHVRIYFITDLKLLWRGILGL